MTDPTTLPFKQSRLPADYHTHTVLCRHATGTTADFKHAAGQLGLPELCFTDHCPEPSGYDAGHRMKLDEVPVYRDLITSIQDSSPPEVIWGIEGDYFPGCEPFLADFLPSHPFDLVLGSVHYIRDWGFDNPDYLKTWESVDVKGVWREYFRLLAELVDTRLFDVIAHFDLPKKFGHQLRDRDMKEFVQPVLDRVAALGMGVEINTSGWRRTVREAYPSPLILSLAAERDIPITFGSDAHNPGEVGFEFARALALARDTGFTSSLRFRGRQGSSVVLP